MTNPIWERWKATVKGVYTADKDAWGRRTHVEIGMSECEICKQDAKIMRIDSSDGEYHSFDCCKPCFEKLWEKA